MALSVLKKKKKKKKKLQLKTMYAFVPPKKKCPPHVPPPSTHTPLKWTLAMPLIFVHALLRVFKFWYEKLIC